MDKAMASAATSLPSSDRLAPPQPSPASWGGSKATASNTATPKVAIAATPSRDSHDVRHCENARHARAGLPRCSIELNRPIVEATRATAMHTSSVRAALAPVSACHAAQNNSPYPAPESVVKKMTDSAGCMG